MQVQVPTLYVGTVRPMPDDGRPTGIFKLPVGGPVWIGAEGLEGDCQADRRVHGGPEKAVHQFPVEHYRRLRLRFPERAASLVAGAMGENLSTAGMDEASVCIGDVFVLGDAELQVSQPRSPCWKIDARHGTDGLAAYIETEGIAGWYFRVRRPGRVRPGDLLQRVERNADPVSLQAFWALRRVARPALDALLRVADTPGLAPDWRRRLQQRATWLRDNT
ncbi:MOSC domain-containing protein [Flagellatimonas centrodinii]|uniref:MOSC domain-containing protein n=1 Tax=Flagellatimonas centrodinii TaxID=2806210 RepID=UPI001FF03A96|nr:MOSC domain-containing protein [Flagellatimonas centrodinii]ULQ47356.1 MOSC domain-containing protein [Flagellatimonas centrodinii]